MNAQAVVERMEQQDNTPVVLTPMEMVGRAVASGASIEVVEKLMALHERWEANQARKAFDEAMASAKAEIPVIIKNRQVGFASKKSGAASTNYRHEDMGEIARTVDPILSKHGLSYRFRTSSQPNEPISVTCIVSHRLGHSEENSLMAGRDDTGNKNSIQQIGSTITYLQRYTLKAALGLASASDDDGQIADAPSQGVPTVTEAQVEELLSLIERSKSTSDKFCEVAKIETVPDLLAAHFDAAKDMLMQRIRKIEAGPAVDPKAQFDAMERNNG